jgi:5-methylcytosine-specific restriction endonuclease McrA
MTLTYEPKVRVEIRVDKLINKSCEGSLAEVLAFLKAAEKEQNDKKPLDSN